MAVFRAPEVRLEPWDYIRAGVLTAAIPFALAYAAFLAAPWACDRSAWLCLLPITLKYAGPIAGVLLPIVAFLNRRRARPFPDGPLVMVAGTSVGVQVLVSGLSLWRSAPHMREIFFYDMLILPQGFAAGAIIGVVFYVSLFAIGWRRTRA